MGLENFFIILDNYLYDWFAVEKNKGIGKFWYINFLDNIKGANSWDFDDIATEVYGL